MMALFLIQQHNNQILELHGLLQCCCDSTTMMTTTTAAVHVMLMLWQQVVDTCAHEI